MTTPPKTIWLINQYASTPDTGIGGRHHSFARELAKRGHKVYLIAARHHHLITDHLVASNAPALEERDGYVFVRLRTPHYQSAHDIKRVIGWFAFAWMLRSLPALLKDRPDSIIYSSPALPGSFTAAGLAKTFDARFIFEVRDIWPLTLLELGGYSPSHPFIRLCQWLEDRAYRRADCVISNLAGVGFHIKRRGVEDVEFHWISNGYSQIDHEQAEPLPKTIVSKIPKGVFTIGYTGTLGKANSIDTILDAANNLRQHSEIAFILVGSGTEKEAIKNRIKNNRLGNVTLIDAVSKNLIPSMLSEFNATVLAWQDTPLYNHGISANKIFDYFSSGKPVLHCYSGAYDPIQSYSAGLTVPAEDAERLADAILHLKHMGEDKRREFGNNAKRAALKEFEYSALTNKLEQLI
ncbi:MAG: glycosyltransferase family 4 protein [Roseibium sp.]